MDRKVKGAWIIHHGQKLKADANGAADFSALDTAAKAASLFSQFVRKGQHELTLEQVRAYAISSGLNPRLELSEVLNLLASQKLIDRGTTAIAVIGGTSIAALNAASEIFEQLTPSKEEAASLQISEVTSSAPQKASEVAELISDEFKFSKAALSDFVNRAELIGFVDAEGDAEDKLYFNGNLFREAGPTKVAKVLSQLTEAEASRYRNFSEKLDKLGCVSLKAAARELEDRLLTRLRAIGMVDVSYVENENGSTGYVTKPDAFHKFVNPIVDDAFDLAKALVAALTYGIQQSPTMRGQIWGVDLLLRKLINGGTVGPATAIGHDYKYLEHRGVVRVNQATTWGFTMELLKPEIGEIALQVLLSGSAVSAQVVERLPSSPMTSYTGPEPSRAALRRTNHGRLKRAEQDILQVLRTKGKIL